MNWPFETNTYYMHISEALIERFLRDECDETEQKAVSEYFIQYPEALQQYLTRESWNSFHTNDILPDLVSDKMFSVIEEKTFRKKKLRIKYYWWISVAASVLLFIAGYWLINDRKTASTMVLTENMIEEEKLPVFEHKINHTQKTIVVLLKDGTVVELAAHSEIKYREPFDENKRDIYLKGQALFKVAKDSSRPFTVYAGGFGTTALGTVFKITAFDDERSKISIRLLSGKIVVAPDSILKEKGVKSRYLTPGQELSFDPLTQVVAVIQLNKKGNNEMKLPQIAERITEPEPVIFNNESLINVFQTISKKYNLEFQYKEETLAGMNFTGIFNNSKESLDDFLNTIGLLNNLFIKQQNNVFYITAQ